MFHRKTRGSYVNEYGLPHQKLHAVDWEKRSGLSKNSLLQNRRMVREEKGNDGVTTWGHRPT